MRNEALDRWVWVLVYGGLLTLVLGLAARPIDAAIGWVLVAGGGVAAAVGAALIAVRARRPG